MKLKRNIDTSYKQQKQYHIHSNWIMNNKYFPPPPSTPKDPSRHLWYVNVATTNFIKNDVQHGQIGGAIWQLIKHYLCCRHIYLYLIQIGRVWSIDISPKFHNQSEVWNDICINIYMYVYWYIRIHLYTPMLYNVTLL